MYVEINLNLEMVYLVWLSHWIPLDIAITQKSELLFNTVHKVQQIRLRRLVVEVSWFLVIANSNYHKYQNCFPCEKSWYPRGFEPMHDLLHAVQMF